jgi:hypothetical protein
MTGISCPLVLPERGARTLANSGLQQTPPSLPLGPALLKPGTLAGQVALSPDSKTPNVFAWLDDVRARPGMFVGDAERPLEVLESMVWGYYTALSARGIVEPVPEMTRHFSEWLRHRTGWSCSSGWAHAIASHSGKRPHLQVFFELVDEYRSLVPVVVTRARVVGNDPRLLQPLKPEWPRPREVELVRYAPTRFHFFRFLSARWSHNGGILTTPAGSSETSLASSKRYAVQHLGIPPAAWTRPKRAG